MICDARIHFTGQLPVVACDLKVHELRPGAAERVRQQLVLGCEICLAARTNQLGVGRSNHPPWESHMQRPRAF